MTDVEFSEVFERRMAQSGLTLVKKATEYARGDRLSNFKKAAGALACSPEKALVGMLIKHLISIIDLVDDVERGALADYPLWDEKIGDAINYLILLDALVQERGGHRHG